ncbi:FAD-dependent oxidoreductase [SAR116 cluster bacterium]|nr:FAD-dependent oxidoreductase [SAR116 cluster bacterium]
MGRIAIIGSGISGIACARILFEAGHDICVFERSAQPGGLIKCTTEEGHLFHRVGGHVFNAKDKRVAEWFWSHFDQDDEFLFSIRNASIFMDNTFLKYPIEQHLYAMDGDTVGSIIRDLLKLSAEREDSSSTIFEEESFYDFLHRTFGKTLCSKYFLPYNEKIWRMNLAEMPVAWLDGKLPMPSLEDIITSNILRQEESTMVHSKFFYPRKGGSQFIVDRLMEGIDIRLGQSVTKITRGVSPEVNGEAYDAVVYTGDARSLFKVLDAPDAVFGNLKGLRSNGTTTVLCTCDANPYSWVYIPEAKFHCHRIIMTGNFSPANNAIRGGDRISCTVEFVGQASRGTIEETICKLPYNLEIVATNYEENSYVIQSGDSRALIAEAKEILAPSHIWLCGRFAEWEYYNMDAAISSAMRTTDEIGMLVK